MRSNGAEEIAIVGMGCRFPGGASNPEAFWDLLKNGQDATCDVPRDRWSLRRFHDPDNAVAGRILTSRGGYLQQSLSAFDANFFGISPREAAPMDPQQRLLLEVAWEAFEDAGIAPDGVRGSRTGVYIGGFTTDNLLHHLNALNHEAISSHTAVSATLTMLSNRLSYIFDLRGPSVSIDTACSSSLVALHLAVQALRSGECTLALAGGVSVMFRPAYSIAMSKGGFLSPDGRCKSFDARADGYGRGEGAGLLILKPLSHALRDGDQVHAVIVDTGVNQDGRTDGITLPNLDAQVELIRDVYARAGIDRDRVAYVEAHGTGTKAGDVVELNALSRAIAHERDPALGPLLVGSAKSNIGHLEAAAGVAGVIKTVLALRNGIIPPSLHFQSPQDGVDLAALDLAVATRLQPWPHETQARFASVNSFGYGGTNAHAVLRALPPHPAVPEAPADRPWLIALSARSERALSRQIRRLHQVLTASPDLSLRDIGYTLARRRSHLPYRTALMARTVEEAAARLRDIADFKAGDLRPVSPAVGRSSVPLVFVYTGMGSQFWGMGRGLLDGEPVAARALDTCDETWRALSGWSLHELFARADGTAMTEPKHAQPANFALQVMITQIARSHGLHPAAVVGHSAGEIAAAWAAGSLSLEDALRVTWERSRWQQTCDGRGAMLAVGLAPAEVPPDILEGLDLAAVNGPHATVLAGDGERIADAARRLKERGVFCKLLAVNTAYHSRQMDALKSGFLQSLAGLRPRVPAVALYSTVTATRLTDAAQDADYWWRNIRDQVAFAPAIRRMIDDGFTLFQEIGPHPALSAGLMECLSAAGKTGACHPSLHRGQDDVTRMLDAIATSYIRGAEPDWKQTYPEGNLVSLLPYAWDREDLWTETEISKADRLGHYDHPFIGRRAGEAVAVWEGDFKPVEHAYLLDHRLEGEPVFPAAGYLELALVARPDRSQSSLIENLHIHRSLETFVTPIVRLHLDGESNRLGIFCRENRPDSPWIQAATCTLAQMPAPPKDAVIDRGEIRSRCPSPLDVRRFYDAVPHYGIEYGPSFQCLTAGWLGNDECLVHLRLQENDQGAANAYFLHPVLLDGALQSVLALVLADPAQPVQLALPVGVSQLRFHAPAGGAVWCHCRKAGDDIALRLFDDDGKVLAELFGLHLKAVELRPGSRSNKGDLLYHTAWTEQPVPAPRPHPRRRCLVFADRSGIAQALTNGGAREHFEFVLVEAGPMGAEGNEPEREWTAARDQPLDAADLGAFDEILYLRPIDLDDDMSGSADDIIGRNACLDLLHILQKIAALDPDAPPAVTVCTCGTQTVGEHDAGQSAPGQSALWGAVRAARLEMPHVHFRLVDLASRLAMVAAGQLLVELRAPKDELEIAYRLGKRHVGRIVPFQAPYAAGLSSPGQRFALRTFQRGGLNTRCHVAEEQPVLAPDEVEIAIVSTGLGAAQGESLRTLGPATAPILDQQCVGRIVALGAGVRHLALGQRVLAFVEKFPIASHVVTAAALVLACPPHLEDDHEGALFDWLAAWHALHDLAHVRAGQWVLICNACVESALAATLLALQAGARVIATAPTQAGRDYLQSLGCDLVLDGLTLAFRDQALRATADRGVDVVFSGLTGEARLAALDCLCPGGICLDVSPAGAAAGDAIPMRYLERDLAIVRVNLVRAVRRHPDQVRAALAAVADVLRGPVRAAFTVRSLPAHDIDYAFTTALQDKSPGRKAIRMDLAGVPVMPRQSKLILDPQATYLVTGGFGGIGLPVLQWLAACGACHIAVISRAGPASAEARALVANLAAAGVRVWSEQADMADPRALTAALERLRAHMPVLKGVIHGAGALDDGAIRDLDAGRLDHAMAAKARGALTLHRALHADPLQFFVCHGSVAAAWGNAGQYAYAAANGLLAGLVRYRRAMGLPGTCINWGPIADAGMAARDERVIRHLARLGLAPLPQDKMIEVLQDAVVENWAICDVADMSWQTWQAHVSGPERRRIAGLISCEDEGKAGQAAAFRQALADLEHHERRAAVFDVLVDIVASILKIPRSRIHAASSLTQLGTDSLMALEMAEVIQKRIGIRPRILFLVASPSLLDLAERLEAELH